MTLLETALGQVGKGPAALNAWLDQNAETSTPEFLQAVTDYTLEAMNHGAANAATAANLLAGSLYMRKGDRKGLLTSQLQQTEITFVTAETTDAYAEAHQQADSLADRALGMDMLDLGFWAIGLAADSAYFASDVAGSDAQRREWLNIAIDTLLRLEPLTPPPGGGGTWQRFVSTLVVIYQTMTQQKWTPAEEAKLRRLAALAERLIPLHFAFNDPAKTEHSTYHLTQLSKQFGNPAVAEARINANQQATKSDTWSEG